MKLRRRAAGLLLGVLIAGPGTNAGLAQPAYPAPGILVDVGQRYMHIHCTGAGSPTVVMDSGLGGASLDWVRIQPEVATYTRVCTYDRAGYGWSEPGPWPRTSLAIVHDLRVLLEHADITGPYVLVGHSFGGLNMRLFASQYPRGIAGLVMVDSSSEHQIRRFEESEAHLSTAPSGDFVLFSLPTIPSGYPAEVRPLVEALTYSHTHLRVVRSELAALRLSVQQVMNTAPMPDVPMVVITRGKRVWPETAEGDLMEVLWMEMQIDLVRRNPRANHTIAKYSGHYVQLEQPEIVLGAICATVYTIRTGDPDHEPPPVWLKQRCYPQDLAGAEIR